MKVPFKIKVNTEEDSSKIQEHVFSKGGSWSSKDKSVKFTKKRYLYVDEVLNITYGYDEIFFDGNPYSEITIDELLKSESITNPTSSRFEKGDCIIALIDKPSGGDIVKGEVGIITSVEHGDNETRCRIDFKSSKDYRHNVHYGEELKIARITREEYEGKTSITKDPEQELVLLKGDIVEALRDNPNGGYDVKKGDKGIIRIFRNDIIVDFPNSLNYYISPDPEKYRKISAVFREEDCENLLPLPVKPKRDTSIINVLIEIPRKTKSKKEIRVESTRNITI